RLSIWIRNEINQPQVIFKISNTIKVGDQVPWFNSRSNSEIYGVVESKGRNNVSIKLSNGESWAVAYCAINTKNLTPILPTNEYDKLTKNDFKVSEEVEFINEGQHFTGSIIKLNFKTATIKINEQPGTWRVSYCLLTKIIDSTARSIVGELI
ncbi:MAG: hypothetical protein ACR2HS_04210, partial [Gammaproteobacteria bacterium]